MDNRRLILSIVLAIAIMFGWQMFAEHMGWIEQPQPAAVSEQAAPAEAVKPAEPVQPAGRVFRS